MYKWDIGHRRCKNAARAQAKDRSTTCFRQSVPRTMPATFIEPWDKSRISFCPVRNIRQMRSRRLSVFCLFHTPSCIKLGGDQLEFIGCLRLVGSVNGGCGHFSARMGLKCVVLLVDCNWKFLIEAIMQYCNEYAPCCCGPLLFDYSSNPPLLYTHCATRLIYPSAFRRITSSGDRPRNQEHYFLLGTVNHKRASWRSRRQPSSSKDHQSRIRHFYYTLWVV